VLEVLGDRKARRPMLACCFGAVDPGAAVSRHGIAI
jgi:hypothetical protein